MNGGNADEKELEQRLRELGRGRGACPAPEDLAAYAEGSLGAEAAERVGAHVRVCGACDVAVERLKTLDDAAPGPRGTRWRDVLRHPAWGYGLAAVLAGGWFVSAPVRPPAAVVETAPLPAAVSAPRFNLDRERGGGDAGARVGDGDAFFDFFVPMRPEMEYTARIESATGEVLSRAKLKPTDALGNCSLYCPRELLARGAARLAVEESGAGSGPRDVSVYVLPRE
jgi:hypothetical protein